MANIFLQLIRYYPGQYLLITNLELAGALERAGFGLAELENVFMLEGRSIVDRKRGGQATLHVNAGRLLTLLAYRWQTKSLLQQHKVDTLQVFLEMVPFLGIFPIPGVRMIASLVSHLPKYYTRGSFSCRLLLQALRSYQGIDALSPSIAGRLGDLGVAGSKISFPKWICVDTFRFRPSPKEHTVTFTSRALAFKNPLLMLSVIEQVLN
ncbi:MAG: hypothetical protein IIA89_10765 [Chloroflexi bacterium]|nr:hypothetical protein [Chloroflexota bacterium]